MVGLMSAALELEFFQQLDLALGAAAVGVGRPYLWGLGAFGQRGVVRIMEILRAELAADMGMAGTGKISQIDRSFVRFRS